MFVDFVGLYCKSKRTRRKYGASSRARSLPRFVAKTSSAAKAVLDLRSSALDGEPNARSDVRPKVRVSFTEMRILNSTKIK